jgi:hypothetical protein
MVRQTGTVHVTDNSAQPAGCWYFSLAATGGTGSVRTYFTGSTLASGTAADGVYALTFFLPSTADGTWTVTGAEACSATPATQPVSSDTSFTVTGHHQPRMSWAVVPTPVPAAHPDFAVKGRVYDVDTGAGMPGVTVGANQDTGCLYDNQGEAPAFLDPKLVTNSGGYFILTERGYTGLQCIAIGGTPGRNPDHFSLFVWFRTFVNAYRPSVSATATAPSVRAGAVDPVAGRVVGGVEGCSIALQRLSGASAWRTESTGRLRDSLRFTLAARPPGSGRFVYRAYFPRCRNPHQVAASSSRFIITAT